MQLYFQEIATPTSCLAKTISILFLRHCERMRNFGRMKSGKRVRSEDKRSGTNDSNELQRNFKTAKQSQGLQSYFQEIATPTSWLAKTISILFLRHCEQSEAISGKDCHGFYPRSDDTFSSVIASVSEAILKNEVIFARNHHGLMSS